jgi:hypothetical protein
MFAGRTCAVRPRVSVSRRRIGMTIRRGVTTILIGAAVLWLGLSAGAQGGDRYKTRLSPVPLDTSQLDTIKGVGMATATLVGNKVAINGSFSGMAGPATVAQLYLSPNLGLRGRMISDLTVTKATSGSVSGTVELTSLQVPLFKKGLFYLQISSEKAPEGNLWGWLVPEKAR